MKNLYIIWVILAVVIFNMILINLIVAILANTYNIFDQKSSGLYLSKILMSRDEMQYDINFGSFLCSLPPLNLIQIPFLLPALIQRENDERRINLDEFVMNLQCTVFIMIFYGTFIVISVLLIPVAWIIGIIDKSKAIKPTDTSMDTLRNLGAFILLGPLILIFDCFADSYYFWQMMF